MLPTYKIYSTVSTLYVVLEYGTVDYKTASTRNCFCKTYSFGRSIALKA